MRRQARGSRRTLTRTGAAAVPTGRPAGEGLQAVDGRVRLHGIRRRAASLLLQRARLPPARQDRLRSPSNHRRRLCIEKAEMKQM